MKEAAVQPQIRQRTGRKISLIAHVVNRKNGFGAEEGRGGREVSGQRGGEEAGLPVVRVKNIGAKNTSSDADGGLVQHREAKVIIRVVTAGLAEDTGAPVQRRVHYNT